MTSLKAKIYDLNEQLEEQDKTINMQGNFLVRICEALEVGMLDGVNIDDILKAIHEKTRT